MRDQQVTDGSPVPAGTGDAGPGAALQLARSLRRLRAQQGLGLNQLAHRAGLSAATLSGLEAGRGNPTMATLLALATELGVSAGDLLPDGAAQQP